MKEKAQELYEKLSTFRRKPYLMTDKTDVDILMEAGEWEEAISLMKWIMYYVGAGDLDKDGYW